MAPPGHRWLPSRISPCGRPGRSTAETEAQFRNETVMQRERRGFRKTVRNVENKTEWHTALSVRGSLRRGGGTLTSGKMPEWLSRCDSL